jgi:hypothetical protein
MNKANASAFSYLLLRSSAAHSQGSIRGAAAERAGSAADDSKLSPLDRLTSICWVSYTVRNRAHVLLRALLFQTFLLDGTTPRPREHPERHYLLASHLLSCGVVAWDEHIGTASVQSAAVCCDALTSLESAADSCPAPARCDGCHPCGFGSIPLLLFQRQSLVRTLCFASLCDGF